MKPTVDAWIRSDPKTAEWHDETARRAKETATTSTIRIGSEMICNNFRNPSLLAKMTSTLDHFSNGRFELGLGIGWDREEHHAYGMEFGSHRERCERLAESLQVIKKLWTEEKPSFNGRFYKLNEAYCSPKPLQRPHLPIMIGGSSNRLLRLVAEHGDSCHTFLPPDAYSKKLSTLEEYCRKLGRDYSKDDEDCGDNHREPCRVEARSSQ
ncbi:MAG TPA: LLM class flavin-dependent oxidoreductase [Candidatus Bathyarchaeia archaeon]|jgi:alkanesulfonate monooxygenase SsuD/methylene tetrahydromethanopterin reductase-like flavin-dependent oxidoreductase (luciferase family)|nr:LLM class flavin-dependent oxidoreductase [Candidatus Bathyarchaeia archaeon]